MPTAWFRHIYKLVRLQRAGYQFSPDSLSMEEWMDMADMKDALEAHGYQKG